MMVVRVQVVLFAVVDLEGDEVPPEDLEQDI